MAKKILILMMVSLFGVSSASFAAPLLINYQGNLLGSGGGPVINPALPMTFRIYDAETGGVLQWSESQTVGVLFGAFNVVLGEVTPLTQATFDNNDNLWIELQIDSDPPLSPRQRLASVPFALQANSANSVPWGGVTSIPAGFADGIDNVGITTEVDPTVNELGKAVLACSIDQVAKWDGSVWACANDNEGNIVEIDPTVNALGKATLNCTTNQVAKWNGTIWACENDNEGILVEVDPTVPSGCSIDQIIKWNGSVWVCADDDVGITAEVDPSVPGAIAAHTAISDAHHTKTTTFTELTDIAADSQIPTDIARDSEIMPTVLANDGAGSGLDADTVDGFHAADLMSGGSLWQQSGSDIFYNSGNVGIGTSNPQEKLDVAGNTTISGNAIIGNATFSPWHPSVTALQVGPIGSILSNKINSIELKSNAYISDVPRYVSAGSEAAWLQIETGRFHFYNAPIATSADAPIVFTERLKIQANGNIGIGLGNPTHPLHMVSGAHVTVGGVWTNASSRTSKENITNLTADQALEALNDLEPVTYNFKNQKDETYAGFIAEDVPELAAMNDRKSLSPMDIVAILTKVVQQQQEEITELKARLK